MRYYKLPLIILAIVLSLSLTACSKSTFTQDPAQKYQNYTAEQLYIEGRRMLAKRNYSRAVTMYEALQSLYPFGGYAEKGQLNLIYAYYMAGQYASAVAAAEQYIQVYPRSKNVDYAYYMKGLSDYNSGRTWVQRALPINMAERDLTSAKQAFYDFRQLVQLFPESKYAADAQQRMIALRDMFAQHELDIAQYYFKRKAYVASANRASYLIRHYQSTPQVKPALIILVQSNQKLGLTKAANDALRVLQLNYPGTKV